jgi:hypothetical protein
VGFEPQGPGSLRWLQAELLPPRCFVTVTVEFAMMSPAQRYGELVTGFATESAVLRELQMVGVARLTSAH